MKKLFVTVMLVSVLALTEPVFAADLGGLYVAPKFFWSHEMQDSTKLTTDFTGTPASTYGLKSGSDEAWGGALAIGYDFFSKFGVPVRTELEYAVRSQTKFRGQAYVNTGYAYTMTAVRKMDISTLFANVFYDFKNSTSFTPYLGGGIGIANIHVKDNFRNTGGQYSYDSTGSSKKNTTNFAWNLATGVAYSFDSHWALDLGYRYCDFGTVKGATAVDGYGYSNKLKSHVTAHEVALGVRYSF